MSAIAATFSDFRPVKSRGVYQIILEVPAEGANAVLIALGGLPVFGKEQWVGVAPLVAEPEVEPPPVKAGSLPPNRASTDAFWMCRRRDFQQWLGVSGEDKADAAIKRALIIQSKTELDTSPEAHTRWLDLVARFHAATMPEERRA